jgi:hypothetical protein
MLGKLKDPAFVRALCAHEAAHVVYFEMMGPIQYRALRSRLEFNEQRNRYQGHFAAIDLIEAQKVGTCKGVNPTAEKHDRLPRSALVNLHESNIIPPEYCHV